MAGIIYAMPEGVAAFIYADKKTEQTMKLLYDLQDKLSAYIHKHVSIDSLYQTFHVSMQRIPHIAGFGTISDEGILTGVTGSIVLKTKNEKKRTLWVLDPRSENTTGR